MIVRIDLRDGPLHRTPTKANMQRSIDAVTKAKNGEPLIGIEKCLIVDVVGILKGLQSQHYMEQGHRRPISDET